MPLVAPVAEDVPCDVRISLDPSPPPSTAGENEALIRYADGVIYRLRNGNEVTAYVSPPITRDISDFLTGNALGILLHQRGLAVLHASCVRRGAHDVAFIGPSGAGKSTLAAYMLQQGYSLVADDFISIRHARVVEDGFPQIKLLPDAARAMGFAAAAARESGEEGKGIWSVDHAASVPPAQDETTTDRALHLFFLHDGDIVSAERLTPRDALFALLSNSYSVSLLDSSDLADEVSRWSLIAMHTPCWKLTRPRDLDWLDRVAEIVELQQHSA